jgi:hypothetical protein
VLPPAIFHHKCLFCGALFRPSKRHPRQRFCPLPECRNASKQRSQKQWLERHPDYFCGPEHVERVRNWRAAHPGYSRGKKRKAKAPKRSQALQDLVDTQVSEQESVASTLPRPSSGFSQKRDEPVPADSCNERALQDLVLLQNPLVVGLISVLSGQPLQETLVPFARGLVERGQRVLGQTVCGSGRTRAQETIHST